MTNLLIKDVINNAIDELSRSRDLLIDNEDAYWSFLVSDIDSSLERMTDINERIEFVLLIAYHMGCTNSEYDFTSEHDCCSRKMLERYLQAASGVEIKYYNGVVDLEWAYGTAGAIAEKLFAELAK